MPGGLSCQRSDSLLQASVSARARRRSHSTHGALEISREQLKLQVEHTGQDAAVSAETSGAETGKPSLCCCVSLNPRSLLVLWWEKLRCFLLSLRDLDGEMKQVMTQSFTIRKYYIKPWVWLMSFSIVCGLGGLDT